jgi:hypothetical protein
MAGGIERVKRNSNLGYTTDAARQVRSVRTLMQRGGYVPDPQREARARRVTRTRNQLIRDLGGDPSKAQMLLAANAAIYAVWLQDNAERMLSGAGVETREYVNVSRACMQTLQALGIKRQPRDVMSLAKYLEGKNDDSAGDITQDPDRS